jgi:xylulose-5-phosphate/fructose-6-phosphate phosphoketolase
MPSETLATAELALIDAYWRAANYLSVGQIYLLDNPLLKQPLEAEHVKPRLLGHFGTTPGLNFIYAHLNRAIRARDLSAIYITGPGHGGPGLVANAYLEGTYSLLQEGRLYQLVREHDTVRERTLEITFLEPGAEAYVFTFA